MVASILVSCSLSEDKSSRGDEIILESDHFVLTVGNDAVARSLVLKSNGEECLMPGESISLFSVTQERPYHNEIKLGHPNKKTTFQADTIYKEGDRLIVGFELVPYEAVIKINETPSYVGFSLEGFKVEPGTYPDYLKITPPPATEICLLQLAIRDRENFGEWLNVSWDDNVAINVLGTDPYAYIDFEKRNGFTVLKASAIKEIQFEGTGAALIVSGSDKLLDNIKRLEEDFDLPRGVESRRSDLINASYYWTANVNPSNVDEHIKYAKMGGFRTMSIYYPSFEGPGGYSIIGRYEIDKRLNDYPQ